MGKLTAGSVAAALKTPGKYSDGGGLFLIVRGPGVASWVARLQSRGRRREYGLGPVELVSLSDAREKCRLYRRELREGRDPKALTRPPPGMIMTFRDAAYAFLEKKFTDANRFRARRRMEMHALPKLGSYQVQTIDADLIAETLAPIWLKQPETGRMVRSLIVRTLCFARPDGGYPGLGSAIGIKLGKQPSRGNRAAMDYRAVPTLMKKLADKKRIGALALRLAILCASRSQEVRGARWSEIDFENALWVIPAERMKMRRIHRVPLSPEALAVLEEAALVRRAGCGLIFPSSKNGWLSDMTLTKVLRDLGERATQHGFRSSFRDWVADKTTFPDAVAEAALAHVVPDAVVAAYRRTTFEEQRRELMNAWGAYCSGSAGATVVSMAGWPLTL